MTICEPCDRRMVANGRRSTPAVGLDGDRLVDIFATTLRLRCPVCGRSDRETDPELRAGFRVTEEAAARIVELSCSLGPEAASQLLGTERSIVSRLLAAERADHLAETTRPAECRLVASSGSSVVAADAWSGRPVAVFESVGDPLLAGWLARPAVPTILPDAPLLASVRTAGWGTIALVRSTFEALASTAVVRSARRLGGMIGRERSRAVSRLLGKPRADLDRSDLETLRKWAAPGTQILGFLAMRDRLLGIHACRTLHEARSALGAWRRDCVGTWARIFAPVLSMLDGLGNLVLASPLSLRPLPAVTCPAPTLRSAAARTLVLRHPHPTFEPGYVPSLDLGLR